MLVVTSQDSNLPTLIEYGRVFENIFLKIREKGIAIHPMTQMLEEEPWKKQVPKELGLAGEGQWVLRIRYLKSYPPIQSVCGCFIRGLWFVKT